MRVNNSSKLAGVRALAALVNFTPEEPEGEPEAERAEQIYQQFNEEVMIKFWESEITHPMSFESASFSDACGNLKKIGEAQKHAKSLIEGLLAFGRKYRERPAWNATRKKGITPRGSFKDFAGILKFVVETPMKVTFWEWQWHPQFDTLEDLLRCAVAYVFETDTVQHLGKCEHCGRYYVSSRRQQHRFCPDTDCRDLYWRKLSGSERASQSRRNRQLLQRRGHKLKPSASQKNRH